MNVTDQWMLERMQQAAAAMASSVPQLGQNSEASKTEKGDSFKDMMDKAKDQKVEAPKKAETPKKTEKAETVQKTEQTQTTKVPVKTDGKTVELTAEEAAMLAAGYAALIPSPEGGNVFFVTVRDENGNLVLPLVELEDDNYAFRTRIVDNDEQWTMEPTNEVIKALEQLLKDTDDPRPMDVILGKLAYNKDGTPIESKLEVVVNTPEAQQTDDEEASDLTGELLADKPLFKDVKAAPIKVGENFQLDTQEPEMDANLANAIRYAAQQGMKQIEIKLSPENLGSLTIKVTQGIDGSLQVVLHASNAKAANLLTQHLDGLNTALQGYGQTQVHVEVQRNENSQQSEQQQQQANPDGHNQQQHQQQQRRQEEGRSQDFVQRLRLGLYGLEDFI